MKKETYDIYFDQINQTRYTVKAESREAAIRKAEREWRSDYGYPSLRSVERQGKED